MAGKQPLNALPHHSGGSARSNPLPEDWSPHMAAGTHAHGPLAPRFNSGSAVSELTERYGE